MASPARKAIPQAIQTGIVVESRRRCALCFHLHDDLAVKAGQIAHLDRNPANFAEDNLAFLCLGHHDEYDSRTSQRKGFTVAEVKTARTRLHQAMAEGRHVNDQTIAVTAGQETDRKTLADIVILLTGDETVHFVRYGFFTNEPFDPRALDPLRQLMGQGAEREFIDFDLELLRSQLKVAISGFLGALGRNTRPVTEASDRFRIPPEWMADGSQRFNQARQEIIAAGRDLGSRYDDMVRMARARLAP